LNGQVVGEHVEWLTVCRCHPQQHAPGNHHELEADHQADGWPLQPGGRRYVRRLPDPRAGGRQRDKGHLASISAGHSGEHSELMGSAGRMAFAVSITVSPIRDAHGTVDGPGHCASTQRRWSWNVRQALRCPDQIWWLNHASCPDPPSLIWPN